MPKLHEPVHKVRPNKSASACNNVFHVLRSFQEGCESDWQPRSSCYHIVGGQPERVTLALSSMEPPKVLILCSSFLPTVGGAQYELKWFLDYFDRMGPSASGVELHFAYPNERSRPFARFDNIATHELNLQDRRAYSVARMIFRLGRILRDIRPDVVHCHGVLPTGAWAVLASRMFGIKTRIVATSHGDDIVSLPEYSYGSRTTARSRFFARLVTRRLARHILPSRAMTKFAIEAGTSKSRVAHIPNGIPVGDEFDFEIGDASVSTEDSQLNRNGTGLNILCLSSARRIKNLDSLIEAFSLAKDQLGDSKLLITCTDERIIRLVKDRGLSDFVEFIGEVTGPLKHAYFRKSDVLCVVSHFESFSLTALEGMKHGCAVVAREVGGIPEFIEHEHSGLLLSSGDPSHIASALVKLMKDWQLRSRLIERGRKTVQCYSMSRIVAEHLELYRTLVAQDQGQALTT